MKHWSHKMSHRKAMALAAAAACSAALLTACGGSDAPAEPVGGDGAKIDSDVTITYAVQSFSHDAIRPIIDEFTEETGIKVELASGPSSGQDLLTKLVPSFQSGKSPYDVIDADDPSCAALIAGGWLLPLSEDAYADYEADLSDGMKEGDETWNQKDGEHYRLYHNWDIGYFWVDEPLLKESGVSAPKTWDDVLAMSDELSDKGIFAFADAAAKPGLTFVYLAYLTAQAGGDIYAFDDGTRQAFEYAKELIDAGAFPKDALTWNYDQSNAAYMEDKVATMRQWPFFTDVAKGNKAWYAEEKAVISAPPAGPAGPKTWAGGWGMAIPKASEHPEEAAAFVAYMNSPEVAVKLAQASSFFTAARTSVLDALAPEGGLVAAMKQYADNGWVAPRPFHPQAAQAEAIIDDIGQSYLTGQLSLDEAMDRGRDQIEALG